MYLLGLIIIFILVDIRGFYFVINFIGLLLLLLSSDVQFWCCSSFRCCIVCFGCGFKCPPHRLHYCHTHSTTQAVSTLEIAVLINLVFIQVHPTMAGCYLLEMGQRVACHDQAVIGGTGAPFPPSPSIPPPTCLASPLFPPMLLNFHCNVVPSGWIKPGSKLEKEL